MAAASAISRAARHLQSALGVAAEYIQKGLIALRAYPWRELPRRARLAMPAVWQRARNSPQAIWRQILLLPQRFRSARSALLEFHARLQNDGQLRFRSILWSVAVVFLAGVVLVGQNPWGLTIPLLGFSPPRAELRREFVVFAASRNSGKPAETSRLFLPSGDLELDLRRAASLICHPGELSADASGAIADVEPLPDLGIAIRKIWLRESGGKRRLIIDMREETLETEVRGFLSSRRDEQRTRQYFLDAFFAAYTATIFRLQNQADSVEYLIEGRRRTLSDMKFDLSKRYLRGSVRALSNL